MSLPRPAIAVATVVIAVAMFVGGVFGLGHIFMNGVPVPKAVAENVTPGMTMNDVRSLLGSPSNVNLKDDGSTYSWVYSRWYMWTFFSVYFRADGKVDCAEYGD